MLKGPKSGAASNTNMGGFGVVVSESPNTLFTTIHLYGTNSFGLVTINQVFYY